MRAKTPQPAKLVAVRVSGVTRHQYNCIGVSIGGCMWCVSSASKWKVRTRMMKVDRSEEAVWESEASAVCNRLDAPAVNACRFCDLVPVNAVAVVVCGRGGSYVLKWSKEMMSS